MNLNSGCLRTKDWPFHPVSQKDHRQFTVLVFFSPGSHRGSQTAVMSIKGQLLLSRCPSTFLIGRGFSAKSTPIGRRTMLSPTSASASEMSSTVDYLLMNIWPGLEALHFLFMKELGGRWRAETSVGWETPSGSKQVLKISGKFFISELGWSGLRMVRDFGWPWMTIF